MLRNWYLEMLEKAKNQGVVLEIRTLHDEYFKNNGAEATTGQATEPACLPYFEGDYIPGEIENIIKEITAEEAAKNKNREDLPSVTTSNKGGSKKGTRSNPGELVNVSQDKVMLRLGLAMTNMKENFMVVHLRSRAFAAAVERGDDVSKWTEQDDEPSKRMKIGGKDSGMLFPSMQPPKPPVTESSEGVGVDKAEPPGPNGESKNGPNGNQDDENSLGSVDVSVRNGADNDDPLTTFADDRNDKDGLNPIALGDLEPERLNSQTDKPNGVTSADDTLKKRGFNDIEPAIARFAAANRNNTPIGDTVDEDEPQEIEMFESRQQFLNYCQTNHFQFDELRRAKHTTMMMLFQLHHPNAPKFIPQCGACYREITHGTRYHCSHCSNYDLCEDCYEPVTSGKWADRGPKFQHDSKHMFAAIDAEADVDVQKNREERSRAIKAHLELLAHAASCEGPPACTLNNCPRMKKLFEHVRSCNVMPKKSCKICSRILTLLTVHARSCNVRNGNCPLPYCDRIREKMRRRRQQQQLMDDRRRQAQNQLYRDGSQQQ